MFSCVFCFFGWVSYVHSKYVYCVFCSMIIMLIFYYTLGITLLDVILFGCCFFLSLCFVYLSFYLSYVYICFVLGRGR